MMKLIISYHADVNAKDILGRTPLIFACKNDDFIAIKVILVDINFSKS